MHNPPKDIPVQKKKVILLEHIITWLDRNIDCDFAKLHTSILSFSAVLFGQNPSNNGSSDTYQH